MATRRTAKEATSPPPSSPSSGPATDQQQEKSDTSPAVPLPVIYKLIGFTIAMIAAPLMTYFIAVRTFFEGNSTYAGAVAAASANVVMIAFIIVAVREDQGDGRALGETGKRTKAE